MKKTMLFAMVSALSLTAAASVWADEMTVFDAPVPNIREIKEITPSFGFNAQLGRAWVNVAFVTPQVEMNPLVQEHRMVVPGLSFDPAQNALVLKRDGKSVTCALVSKSLFGETVARDNGQCRFEVTPYQAQQDNGYEMVKFDKVKVAMKF